MELTFISSPPSDDEALDAYSQAVTTVAERLSRRFRDFAVDDADGLRFSREGEWLHVRPSGTEPVVRLYGEASSPERLAEVMTAGRDLILK